MNSRGQDYLNHLLKKANEYISYGIQEGCYDADMFKDMNSDDLIAFYRSESDRGDYAYESAKEEGI